MTLTLAEIERRLSGLRDPDRVPMPTGGARNDGVMRRCAVAVILRECRKERSEATVTEILFIRRAEKDHDPWSGHMAFPGGHVDPGDASALAAAIRETREEIGIELPEAGRHIATLEPQRPARHDRASLIVVPFVFTLTEPVAFRTNHEVAEIVWAPLAPLLRAENHVAAVRKIKGDPRSFSGYRVSGGHLVWGLTYRMLHSLFAVLDPDWREPAA